MISEEECFQRIGNYYVVLHPPYKATSLERGKFTEYESWDISIKNRGDMVTLQRYSYDSEQEMRAKLATITPETVESMAWVGWSESQG